MVSRKSRPHSRRDVPQHPSLGELRQGEQGVLERIELPSEEAERIMLLGFIPGTQIVVAGSAPGGDPRVYRVDGAEVALRADTARRLKLRRTQDSLQEVR
jgi:ferrous iron transport protein A